MICLIYFIFVKELNCSDKNSEDSLVTPESVEYFETKVEPTKYYWFEAQSRYYLFRFYYRLGIQKVPLVLVMYIPSVNTLTWPDKENWCFLKHGFDYFKILSSFSSIFPNEQNTVFTLLLF